MKSIKSIGFSSLVVVSLLILSVSCKKSSNNSSNPASLKSGTMTATINGKASTFTVVADSSYGYWYFVGAGAIGGTTDTLAVTFSFVKGIASYASQYVGYYSDTANDITGNTISYAFSLPTAPFATQYQDVNTSSMSSGTINTIGGGSISGTLNGTLYVVSNQSGATNIPDTLVITNGEFNAKVQ